jgi:predicted small lipoprotein YifL
MKIAILVLMVCSAVAVAACGQKGALYLPDKNASVVTRPAGAQSNNPPAPAQPAPAPTQQPQNKDKDKSDDSSQSSKPKS